MAAAGETERGALRRLTERARAIDPILWLIGAVLLLHYFSTRGIFQGKASGDGFFAFLYYPALLRHHTFDMTSVASPQLLAGFGREVTGMVANPNPIGPPILWTPFYFLGLTLKRLVILATESFHGHPPAFLAAIHAYVAVPEGEFDFFVTGLGSLTFALIGIWRMHALLQRRLSLTAARFGVATAVLASPLWWYITTQPLYQHACAFFAVTVFVERWDAYRGESPAGYSLRQAALLGVWGGLCLLMRTQQGLWLILPALDLAAGLWRRLRDPLLSREQRRQAVLHQLLAGLVFVACVALVFAPQLLLWKHYYGRVRAPTHAGPMRWGNPTILAMLFSMRAGLFPWIPSLYLVLPGLLWLLWRRVAGLALPLALGLMFLAQLWVNSAVYDFHSSWAFGPRRFTECVVIFALGLAGLWQALSRRGRAVLLVFAVCATLWNGLLIELMRTRRIKSSSSGAFPASVWVRWAGGPAWLGRAFERVGFPFAQPAGLIFSLAYRVAPATFEGIIGNYPFERDNRYRARVLGQSIRFADHDFRFVVSGVLPPAVTGPGTVATGVHPSQSTVRVLIPLRDREPLRLRLVADLGPGASSVGLRWNGTPIAVQVQPSGLIADIPAELTHAHVRVNELELTQVPSYATLFYVDLELLGTWWR